MVLFKMKSDISEKGETFIRMNQEIKEDNSEYGAVVFCCKSKSRPLPPKREKKKNTKFTHRQRLSLCMLALADFMSYCSMSIMAPFYPAVSSAKGVSESLSGMVFGYFALIVFLSSPIMGKVLPKFGAKYIFILGLLLNGLSNIIFGFIGDIEDYTLFVALSFIIRTFVAIGASGYSTAAYVLIINIFPDNAGGVRGLLETFVGLGLCAGPGIGGILYSVGGFGLPFYVVGVITIITAALNTYLLIQPEKNEVEKSGSLFGLLKLPPILMTCLIMIVASMSCSFLDPTLEPHVRKYNLSSSQVGLLFLLNSASWGIFSPLVGMITDKMKNYTWLMTTGLFCTTVVLLLLGPSPLFTFLEDSIWLSIANLPALGMFAAMTIIPTYQYILDSSMNNGCKDCLGTQSIIAGLWSSIYSLGEVIGPILAGTLMEHFGFAITCTTFAFINFVTGVIALTYFKTVNLKLKALAKKKGVDNVVFYIESPSVKELNRISTIKKSEDNIISIRL